MRQHHHHRIAAQIVGDVSEVITSGCQSAVSGVKLRRAGEETESVMEAAVVINCAGPWAGALAETHGLDLPIRP
jgi:glycine/D-amino acid oxidase-like deaminating enzyme